VLANGSMSSNQSGEGETRRKIIEADLVDYKEIRKHGHVLTPGRYIAAEQAEEDDEPFEEKMRRLVATLNEQFANLKSQIVTSSWGGIRRASAIASLIRVCALNAKRDKLWPVAMRH
jgi:type I restriction-modification system DNA methylase subunit